MKKEALTKSWMQCLLMAAVVAVALPDAAFADLATTATNTQGKVFASAMAMLSYGCYAVGGFMGIGGVMKLKAHSENPTNAPLSHGIGRVAAAAGFLTLPTVMGMLADTSGQTVDGTKAFQTFTF